MVSIKLSAIFVKIMSEETDVEASFQRWVFSCNRCRNTSLGSPLSFRICCTLRFYQVRSSGTSERRVKGHRYGLACIWFARYSNRSRVVFLWSSVWVCSLMPKCRFLYWGLHRTALVAWTCTCLLLLQTCSSSGQECCWLQSHKSWLLTYLCWRGHSEVWDLNEQCSIGGDQQAHAWFTSPPLSLFRCSSLVS